ncbi:hypothetical protein SRABI70_04425 [Pseudomonas sp. Bi70]|nr:hypothetical protein SRABI70_04425 [Pseudomonas sp. Bi70]
MIHEDTGNWWRRLSRCPTDRGAASARCPRPAAGGRAHRVGGPGCLPPFRSAHRVTHRRHFRPCLSRLAGRCRHPRDLSPGRHRQRPGRSGLRPRPVHQFRRHPRLARTLSPAGPGAALGVRQLPCSIRRAAARPCARVTGTAATVLLRGAEGHGRAADQRLLAQGLCRWPRVSPADDFRAPRQT